MILLSDDYQLPAMELLETARDVVNWLGWHSDDSHIATFAIEIFNTEKGRIILTVLPKLQVSQLSLEFGNDSAEYAQMLLDEINAVIIKRQS